MCEFLKLAHHIYPYSSPYTPRYSAGSMRGNLMHHRLGGLVNIFTSDLLAFGLEHYRLTIGDGHGRTKLFQSIMKRAKMKKSNKRIFQRSEKSN